MDVAKSYHLFMGLLHQQMWVMPLPRDRKHGLRLMPSKNIVPKDEVRKRTRAISIEEARQEITTHPRLG